MSAFTSRPELRGSLGAVAASHWLAAQSGMAMLERGGNAFDAAAAAGFVLQVVEPQQCGPGGEAPMILYSATEQQVFVVDGQGPAPAAASAQAFADLGLDLVPGDGLLPACVPAALGSWLALLDRFGSLPLDEVLAPAIGYARNGFPASTSLSAVLVEVERRFAGAWPTTAQLWLGRGVPAPGAVVRNEPLAATYERILAEARSAGGERHAQLEAARRAIYEGFVADTIDVFARREVLDSTGVHAGLITGSDLAAWRAGLEAPARLEYHGVEVCKTQAWGQGPVFLQQLGMLRGVDLASLGAGSPELVHVVAECAKLAFADREAFYGDPRHVEVPLADLLDPAYCAERLRQVGETASLELRPGRPGGREPRLAQLALRAFGGGPGGGSSPARRDADPGGGGSRSELPAVDEGDPEGEGFDTSVGYVPRPWGGPRRSGGDTCHVDAADRFGNLISATPSGGWLQASPSLPGLGFCLGTRAQMFWLEQGLASSLAPGRRPRTTLSPTLVLRDGRGHLAFGTPGGDQQDQWPLRFFLYHHDLGLGLQEAIDAASWHTTHEPSSFWPREAQPGELLAESSLGEPAIAELRRRGHRVVESPPWSLGLVTAVGFDEQGLLAAAADARSGRAYAAAR